MVLARFSTISGCPSGPAMPWAIRRDTKSFPPPALEVTMRIGFTGYAWPETMLAHAMPARPKSNRATERGVTTPPGFSEDEELDEIVHRHGFEPSLRAAHGEDARLPIGRELPREIGLEFF